MLRIPRGRHVDVVHVLTTCCQGIPPILRKLVGYCPAGSSFLIRYDILAILYRKEVLRLGRGVAPKETP